MNWRMLAIAAALLLIVPVGIGAGDDTNPLLDLWGEASAVIQDVEVFRPPQQKVYNDTEFVEPEQLVEGHTTFVTIDFVPRYENVTGNLSIVGVVHCEDHVEAETFPIIGGIGIPYKVRRAQLECYTGQRVIVTPDPFSGDPGSLSDISVGMASSGRVFPFQAPDGQAGYVEELKFTYEGRDYLAWATPVLLPFDTPQGTKNFLAPLPIDGLRQNGDIRDYRVVFE